MLFSRFLLGQWLIHGEHLNQVSQAVWLETPIQEMYHLIYTFDSIIIKLDLIIHKLSNILIGPLLSGGLYLEMP